MGQRHLEWKMVCKPGETRNVTLTLPKEFPVGAAEMTITGTGGLRFEEKRDVIVYDNRYVILVQTSASTYHPDDTLEARVIVTDENLIPIENGQLTVEIYDANLKLVGQFRNVHVRSGLTETLQFPIASHPFVGPWLVSATMDNTTSSVEVLVARPATPSFNLKAIFQRYLRRTDKTLRGVIEVDSDSGKPIFGRCTVAIGPITEQEVQSTMKNSQKTEEQSKNEEWRKWKSQKLEIAGRVELNYDLLSLFNIDVTKVLAVDVYIQVTDLMSGQERIIRHVIPVYTREVIYDIRPLEFYAGMKNEFEVIAKRPDGKPTKMEDMIVTVRMIMGNEQGKQQEEKMVEIKDFYTRGRNDIGLFNLEVPENCIGVLMTITPLDEDGKVRGYRTHAVPLIPTPRRRGRVNAKLSVELLPSTVAPVNTDVNVPVVSTQIPTVGRVSNFYVQLMPTKPVEKFESLPMSYVLMTNGRILRTGEFNIEPTKECQTKTVRAVRPEGQRPPACVFNGTLPIQITRDMVPYSTLLVYTFQPSFGFNLAESYRFSVAGLFQSSLTLNAAVVPFTPTETTVEVHDHLEENVVRPVTVSPKVQDRTRVELSFTGAPDSTVGLNVVEYDGILDGLLNDITKERLLKYLTNYEQVPIVSMPVNPSTEEVTMKPRDVKPVKKPEDESSEEATAHKMGTRRLHTEEEEEQLMDRERMTYKVRYPVEKMFFGVSSSHSLPSVEGDDAYITLNMEKLYGDVPVRQPLSSHYQRKLEKATNQYDVTVGDNDHVIATSIPRIFTAVSSSKSMPLRPEPERDDDMEIYHEEESMHEESSQYGTPSWYERMHNKLNAISQEALTFMQSGLTIVSDFESLRIPKHMQRANLTKLFSKFHQHSKTMFDRVSFDVRDQARLLLEEYLKESDLSMATPTVMLEEEVRMGYYRSVFFNTSRIESQGTGKVVLPRTKPYSTWLATGYALNAKSGLAIAQPICLPTNRGLFVLGECPEHVQTDERVLLTYGINNYLGKDVNNVILRIRASPDFDLMEQTQPERVVSSSDKDYVLTVPSLKSNGVEVRHMIVVPKRAGVIQIVIEVESELGGDYEVLTMHVREANIVRKQVALRLFDLTSDKKSYGPIVEKVIPSPSLRSVKFSVAGTGVDRLLQQYAMSTHSLMGIDRAIVNLYRLLSLRQYLNETMQTNSQLYHLTTENITTAYQNLQLYNDIAGTYSFISDQGVQQSSLYLTTLAFGAMVSPMMPFRDNVTLNRTLNAILAYQKEDGSFDDNGLCLHYRFCAGEYRRESLTALVLYSFTRDNAIDHMPEFIRHRLWDGENSPIRRAQRYLESRVPDVKSNVLVITLFEMAFMQNRLISSQLREKIRETLISRKLTLVPEDGSKYLKNMDDKMTFDDQLLVNVMTVSLYTDFDDWKTALDICRWVVSQLQTHPHYDTVLDAVFTADAWLNIDSLFRKRFGSEKVAITIDVTTDNGQKQQFKINEKNMDITQQWELTLPVQQISYTVNGFGLAFVRILQKYAEKEQKPMEQVPFQITHELTPMSWINEIKAKTCMTYTPTPENRRLAKDNFNRTVVVEVEIPSGMRVNLRQLGFFLSHVEEVMHFTYNPWGHKLLFFIHVPSTHYGKPICFDWCIERLSTVISWAPTQVRVYDYIQPEVQLTRLVPLQLEPSLLGYPYVEAVHKVRPSLEQMANLHETKQQNRV